MLFKKYRSSYIYINLLHGLNEGKIYAYLYNIKSDLGCKFIPIISKNCIQFTYKSNLFYFITTHLNSIMKEY